TESPQVDWCLLFPRVADELEGVCSEQLGISAFRHLPSSPRRRGIVVVDGTWAQARRMRRRLDVLRSLPTFELPPGPPTQWTVRTQSDASRMSTAEATIRALAICEGATALRPVKRYFNLVSARMMFMKAALRAPEVPPEWSDEIHFDDPTILGSPDATGLPEDPQE
ncbi:MAG: DTW domain-containing protein, partial [Nannocystaceae bacterium]